MCDTCSVGAMWVQGQCMHCTYAQRGCTIIQCSLSCLFPPHLRSTSHLLSSISPLFLVTPLSCSSSSTSFTPAPSSPHEQHMNMLWRNRGFEQKLVKWGGRMRSTWRMWRRAGPFQLSLSAKGGRQGKEALRWIMWWSCDWGWWFCKLWHLKTVWLVFVMWWSCVGHVMIVWLSYGVNKLLYLLTTANVAPLPHSHPCRTFLPLLQLPKGPSNKGMLCRMMGPVEQSVKAQSWASHLQPSVTPFWAWYWGGGGVGRAVVGCVVLLSQATYACSV